jgi:hypothetical protein
VRFLRFLLGWWGAPEVIPNVPGRVCLSDTRAFRIVTEDKDSSITAIRDRSACVCVVTVRPLRCSA